MSNKSDHEQAARGPFYFTYLPEATDVKKHMPNALHRAGHTRFRYPLLAQEPQAKDAKVHLGAALPVGDLVLEEGDAQEKILRQS